jgi:hypothetical protein
MVSLGVHEEHVHEAIRREIFPWQYRVLEELIFRRASWEYTLEADLVREVAASTAWFEVEGAFYAYEHQLPQGWFSFVRLVKLLGGGPSVSRTLRFYMKLKAECRAPARTGRSAASAIPAHG